jgi:hypothetical protein
MTKGILAISCAAVLLSAGCSQREESVTVEAPPPLPATVTVDSDSYYVKDGYYYHYQDNAWRYSRSRRGPWLDLPRDHYPQHIVVNAHVPGQPVPPPVIHEGPAPHAVPPPARPPKRVSPPGPAAPIHPAPAARRVVPRPHEPGGAAVPPHQASPAPRRPPGPNTPPQPAGVQGSPGPNEPPAAQGPAGKKEGPRGRRDARAKGAKRNPAPHE